MLRKYYPAAAKANQRAGFPDLHIYGLLTDLEDLKFYAYDPVTERFAFDESLDVNVTRDHAFTDMVPGMLFLCTCVIHKSRLTNDRCI